MKDPVKTQQKPGTEG